MSKLNTAKIPKGLLTVNKFGAEFEQQCPYGTAKCGLWCPKCYVTEKTVASFGKGLEKRLERTVHTCGGSYELL